MANYKGRTFTAVCGECGAVYSSTRIIGAQAQADACYEKHFPHKIRDTKEIMDEIKEKMPEVWEE